MLTKRILSVAMILAICLLAGQCGKSEGPTQTSTPDTTSVDSIPPAAIADLLAKNPTTTSVLLLWTAPGDDGLEGTAESYDIRYYGEAITEANWDDAVQFDGEPAPKPAGQVETVNIDGLDEITEYFFAVKATDDAGNMSGLSNPVSETTLNESMKPAAVTDLSALAVGEYTFQLTWTASGDDGKVGTASEYDIRYSMDPITPESWATATRVKQPPVPKSAGEPETLLVSQMRSQSNYYFAMMLADEVPNWSGISNVAFGLGYNVQLFLPNHHIHPGEELKFFFRAPGEVTVTINLNQYGIMGCDPTHVWVKDWIVPSVSYAEGIYEISYDFNKSGEYLPFATYYVVLCWDFEFQTSSVVYFESP